MFLTLRGTDNLSFSPVYYVQFFVAAFIHPLCYFTDRPYARTFCWVQQHMLMFKLQYHLTDTFDMLPHKKYRMSAFHAERTRKIQNRPQFVDFLTCI